MKIILTRHGETEENAKGIFQGHLPGKLSRLGIEQARKLAERLKEEKIDAIYSSDLARAADTAKEVAKYHLKIQVQYMQELREMDFGDYSGKTKQEIGEANVNTRFADGSIGFPNGESDVEVFRRVRRFFDKIIEKHKHDTILIVTHYGISKTIIELITGRKDRNYELNNTNVSIFEIDEDKNHKIHLFNCTKHL